MGAIIIVFMSVTNKYESNLYLLEALQAVNLDRNDITYLLLSSLVELSKCRYDFFGSGQTTFKPSMFGGFQEQILEAKL